jgi:hypothetical protein
MRPRRGRDVGACKSGVSIALVAAAALSLTASAATAEPRDFSPDKRYCTSAEQAEILNRIGQQGFQSCTHSGGTIVCDAQGFYCCHGASCSKYGQWFTHPSRRLAPNLNNNGGQLLQQ